jgi:hypothetical protein
MVCRERLFGPRLVIVDLWIVRSTQKPVDRNLKAICDLRQPMDVQSFEPNVLDIDHPAGAHADNPRNPVRRRLPHLAGIDKPFTVHAEITLAHGLEMRTDAAGCKEEEPCQHFIRPNEGVCLIFRQLLSG